MISTEKVNSNKIQNAICRKLGQEFITTYILKRNHILQCLPEGDRLY